MILYLGSFSVQDVVPNKEGESSKVKVKVRLDIHGVFTIVNASLVEKLATATDTETEKMEVEGQDKAKEPDAATEVCYVIMAGNQPRNNLISDAAQAQQAVFLTLKIKLMTFTINCNYFKQI